MGESKHTPGPWAISDRRHPQNAVVTITAGEFSNEDIATLYGPDIDVEQDDAGVWGDHPIREANARLIAAAPELLDALKALVEANNEVQNALGDGPDVPGFDPQVLRLAQSKVTRAESFALAIIAKAEGRS